jgi:hypothetical protein
MKLIEIEKFGARFVSIKRSRQGEIRRNIFFDRLLEIEIFEEKFFFRNLRFEQSRSSMRHL